MEERGEREMGARQRWLRRLRDQFWHQGVAWCGRSWSWSRSRSRSRAAHIHRHSPFDVSTTLSQEDTATVATANRGEVRYRRAAAAAARQRRESDQDFGCILDQAPAGDAVLAIEEEEEEEEEMMNLAMALAAERQLRAAERDVSMAPFWERTSSLMKEGEEEEEGMEEEEGEEVEDEQGMEEGGDWWRCCVCMERRKGAAFIPCGHTFCRVCARELWAGRGSCPLCNQLILETLDIY